MNTFDVDPDILRVLARDVEQQASRTAAGGPQHDMNFPGGAVAELAAALTAALDNLDSRAATLRADLSHVAQIARATGTAAAATDSASAARLGTIDGGVAAFSSIRGEASA